MTDTTEILSRLDTLAVVAQSGEPYSYCVTIYADAALAIRELERRCLALEALAREAYEGFDGPIMQLSPEYVERRIQEIRAGVSG